MNAMLATTRVPEFLKVLSHDLRWKILTALARSDCSVHEIIQALGEPQNVVSYHLRKLREHQLVTERRSTADERSLYYSLDLEKLRTLYLTTGDVLHPALGHMDDMDASPDPQQEPMPVTPMTPVRVLFLCTQNSARSQLAEALMRQMSTKHIEVVSAGTQPTGVHPLTLRVLATRGIDGSYLRSKHLDELRGQAFDYIITVCDRVREACPTWPAESECIHWSLPDPVQVEGSEDERYHAFEHTASQLTTRLRYFLTRLAWKDRVA
jgi:protein-tyrosine-phosphatase/DNA-binding transcriptional ArsR family regulator